jgi:hypothetical protein
MPGAVTIVARKGKIVHLDAQGVLDLESKKPVAKDSMFRVASMTKPVTGLAIMMMIEEGKVRLNDPVSRYIPEFKNLKVAVGQPNAGGRGTAAPAPAAPGGRGGRGAAPNFYTVPADREITVKDLLTHVSASQRNHELSSIQDPSIWKPAAGRWRTIFRVWARRRSSFSRDRAGPTAPKPASTRWERIVRSHQACRWINSSGSVLRSAERYFLLAVGTARAARSERLYPQPRPQEPESQWDVQPGVLHGLGRFDQHSRDYIPMV